MSADRENHQMTDMTQTDIALLLADAADEVEIGIAPVQEVIRGGRRRRARRWAVATATAVVLAGSTGATLAVTGLPGGGHGDRRGNMAAEPTSPAARHVYEPQQTQLSRGRYKGTTWYVDVQVWGAPQNGAEAERQYVAMEELYLTAAVAKPADLIGKTSFFVTRKFGDQPLRPIMYDSGEKLERLSGKDLESASNPLDDTSATWDHLVVGKVAETAREVTCTWKDGTTTRAKSGPVGYEHDVPRPALVSAAGYPGVKWFACVAPEGTAYKDVAVTR
ncbi:hypothetical protein [Streptomyces sp. NPDC007205]|uniref:hypothetical protein n=1 Tax=Streptomyces sp. NPDC007205 TaxID=3154316 RepID=UPI00340BDD6D